MYVGNIMNLFNKMKADEVMKLGFTSGKSINYIIPSDTMEIVKGDIKITRQNETGRIITFVDCAEVECACIIKED